MFKADILDMAGGKESGVDIRNALSNCAESMSKSPETLNLCASPCVPKYDKRRIPLIIPAAGNSSQEDIDSFNYFSTCRLVNEENPLVKQLGHLNVKDAAADGSCNTTNLLYTGSSVVEYDLVEEDINGKRFMYSEPSVLKEVLAAKTEGRYKVKEVAPKTSNEFLDRLMESSYETINSQIETEGPYVSSGKLLTDIMVLMRLYEEETRRVESACVDPAFRKILAECHGSEETAPLFTVGFITNAALMGLKVVFYPTALEWKNCVGGIKDCTKVKSLLKIQMSVMGQSMPLIVEKIEKVKTKYTFCFKVDIGGSANWNLPGHCKNDPQSFPYHFARLIGQGKNVLEISNKKMVTSLGIVDCVHAKKWMYNYLGEFERRSTYAENILGAAATASNGSEWRRKVLFSDIGPELPFRNKSIAMDLDFCLSGMCYRYIASGQGILLSKRRETNITARTKMFSDGKLNEEEGENEEKKRKKNTAPPVPRDIPADVIAAYDNMIKNQTLSDALKVCDQFGMFLDKENVAPGLAMKILSVSKPVDKKGCIDSLTTDAMRNLKWLSRNDKLKHNMLMQFALLQLVLRYECRHLKLPRDGDLLRSRMKLRRWSVLDFNNIWKFAHEETLKPPTEESLANLSEDDDGGGGGGGGVGGAAREERERFGAGEIIKKMLMTTASTFASGADKEDTMFSWMMVTLAERFCALYNIVSHPEEYYHRQQGRLSFEGGLCKFKKMCEILLPELEVYVPKNAFKVCRRAVRGYEIAVEKNKNATNNKVCKVKLAELKMIHGLNKKTKAINHNEISTTTAVGSKTLEAFQSLFDPLKEESEEWVKKIYGGETEPMDCDPPEDERLQDEIAAMDDEEEEEYREENTTSDVIADFFNCVNDNRSFIFRASLCHRQKYVSVEVVKTLEKELGRLLILKKHNNSPDQVLKEIRERSERMRDWIVPFTMPSNSIDVFFSNSKVKLSDRCNCFQVYSSSEQEESCEKCINLLVIPPSIHLKSLTTALKFNTMASERHYFSDVSAALGFTPNNVSRNKRKSNILSEKRWNSFSKYKCGGDFLAKTSTRGLYENVIVADNETITAFKPRTASRQKSAEINDRRNSGQNLNKHTGFFSGVWALCADHDLETTVVGSTISSPFSPTPLLKMPDEEIADTDARISLAADAKRFFEHNPSISFFMCFEQMVECMSRTNLTPDGSSDPRGDVEFFSGLIKKHKCSQIPGVKLWTILSTVSECFKNSLPVDWATVITNWTSEVLNLTGGVNNVDESGAVFETSRFLSVCARSFFGSCLNVPLGVEVWEKLLNEKSWVGNLVRAYEAAIEDSDVRVVENFISSSNFMTNNNMIDKLKIVQTKNDSVTGIWKEEKKEEGTSLRKRAEWLAATELECISFSFVLAAVSLFRVLLEGEDVKKLAERYGNCSSGGVCCVEQQLVPLIRGFKITSGWCKTFVFNNCVDSDVSKCISEMRFANVQKDPLFFYRFAGYTIGLIAANDVVLENITRKILDSFDFNGFDTSNWTRFIRYHFSSILLGRRARLLSRPLAFVKNLVGLAASGEKFAKPTGEAAFEKRVCNVVSRLAKLILVKTVDSETVSLNDILDCCILEDEDVTVRSISALYSTVRSEFTLEKADYSYILASNSCTNSQLAKIKSASRLLNCNVSFHDTSTLASAIDADEESIIDPSRDTAMSAGDAEVKKLDNDGNDSSGKILTAAEKDSSSRRRRGNQKQPSGGGILSFDEETIDEDIEPSEFLLATKSADILKKVTKMLRQQDINLNVAQKISKMKTFLTVKTPFNESDYRKLGVRVHVIKAGVEAIRRWEEAVEKESSKIIDECENLQSVGGEYDMSVINPEDYARSTNKNCTYSGEMCESSSFNKALMSATGDGGGDYGDGGENDNFSWLNFQKKSEKLSKHDFYNCGGGRLMGYAAKDMVEFTGEGTAEIRVIIKLFSDKVNDSYWLDVMPPTPPNFSDKEETKTNNKKKWPSDKNSQTTENPILKLKVNGKVKESKSITHCDNLMSMYKVTDQTEGIEDDNFITTKSPKDIFVILGENADKQERYKSLRSFWNCNNGISPRNQIELLKKLLFKDTNILWIKQYDRHINVLNNWGCLNVNNAYDLHFSLYHDCPHEEVRDAVPPMSVFHSRFFDDADYEYLSKTIDPLFDLKKKLQSSYDDDDGGLSAPASAESLLSGLYSREILSSCLDPGGKFCTSYITNSSSVLFTPGTNMRLKFDKVSSMDKNNHVYSDEELAGKEKELNTRSFLAFTLEVLGAVERGVFFEGGKTNGGGKVSSLPIGRVLRPVGYNKVNIDEPNNNWVGTKQNTRVIFETPETNNVKNTRVIFETPETNNVISETNDCILLNCDQAKCLLMSQRALLNSTRDKRYDGSVFNSYSMRYHAGISKGYLLDDKLDLFSIHERTFAVSKKSECDIDVFTKCANHFILPNSDKKLRIFTTDWNMVKSVVQLNAAAAAADNCEVDSTLIPYGVPDNNINRNKTPLEKVSPYNLHAMNGKAIKYHSACFLANPCGPARRLLQRAPNMRICMTNAGIAQISRRLAQSDKIKNVEELIKDGYTTAFKVTSGSSCISVDSSRYFLIDGTYLLGGRIEDVNLQTDMFTRCKLKTEKHVVYNSLFSSKTVSAFLATAIEGTTHSQGLGLLEHVSSIKNNEVANRCNKNFWSSSGIEMEDEKVSNRSYYSTTTTLEEASSAVGGNLKPPSVYTNDEDYIFLRMLYEIAKGADHYNSTHDGEIIKPNAKSNVTRAALYAIIKCYVDCVDQSTGTPRLHVVYFLRSLLNFGGFCTAICSGDGEKSHHLIFTLNSVALNMAAKTIVMLVGPSGNNLKTTIVEVAKKAWLEKFADVSVGVLNSSKDSASSTQANLAYFAGNKNILIIDEVGYQGSTNTERDDGGGGNNNNTSKGVLFSARDDTTAVWKQIDSAMTKAKLKICSKECDDILMSSDDNNKKRKRTEQNSAGDNSAVATITDSAWLMERTVRVKAFANNVVWWNCMSGTVSHTFNDIRTCYNMLIEDRYPFSVSDSHSSPWLVETDAIARHCAKSPEEIGLYTHYEIKEALHCLEGDYASKTTDSDVTSIYESIMSTNSRRNTPGGKISDWKLQLKGMTDLSSKVEKVFNDLVKGDALLRWTTINSIKHADRRPVLTCVPDSKEFKELLVNVNMKDDIMVVKRALGEHRLNPNSYKFVTAVNSYTSDGVLYAFHAVHSGAYTTESPLITNTEVDCINNKNTDEEVLGPILGNISCSAIENHRAKSQKLSSIIFNRGDFLEYEIDEDIYINMGREYDDALFNVMKKPSSKSFPKITTDGALVMSTSSIDCKNILNHIKKTIIDTGKVSNTGSLIRLCVEKDLLDDKTPEQQPAPMDFSSMFPAENNNTLRPGCRKMLTSLIKFKSDGTTISISDIANMVSSTSDAYSAITKHMLPGQFNSNMLKKITTKQASAAMRGIFCKPVVSSISMTPIMTSNSYVFTFFVDEALAKRMVIFPCNTQFAFGSVNENVETFIDLVDSGLKCVHSALTLERQEKWKRAGIVPPKQEIEKNTAIADNWVSTWNESVQRGMRTEEKYVADLSSVAAMLPARALQLLVKNSVLEHRDVTSMARLEENANTFMHMYTTFTLASKSERSELVNFSKMTNGNNVNEKLSDEEKEEIERKKMNRRTVSKTNSKPLQMCQVNPKSLNTMVMAITKSRQGAWAKINTAMNCVLFVETPFVHTSRLFGEDCNLKMFVPKKEGVNPNINLDWCIGLRVPNPDMNVNGYSKEGPMIGAGTAIMKQVCDAWGSTDLRNIMYSCHHLHMLFELVFQFTQPKRKLTSVKIIKEKNKAGMDYVSVIFACLIYKEMMSKLRYPVFDDNGGTNKKTNDREETGRRDRATPLPSPFEIPIFVSMVINKPLAALRSTTNFGTLSKIGAKHHTELIQCITGQLGQTLNVDYLCPTCQTCI